ncbi:hypothetical protein K6U06_02825 [Acidiferrimicrobium sp. IK]|uniref:hypothetical protein n=1 Tax=Acidiferrimicrobium sp. IK TaxID=2871700 RepID=UPI0021CAF31E|nr:hypothetical protein [Acidiferrimicrobium sp. IK]MCU4183280.1 hypothetical protein [Acidiferrimicrobium sp. IK]
MRCVASVPESLAAELALSRGQQREWRRRERRLLAEHAASMLGVLGDLVGASSPVTGLTVAGAPVGTVAVTVPGWRLSLAGVAPGPARALEVAGVGLALSGAGRYGPRWWIALRGGAEPVVVLASHLCLVRVGGGPGRGSRPGSQPSLTLPG